MAQKEYEFDYVSTHRGQTYTGKVFATGKFIARYKAHTEILNTHGVSVFETYIKVERSDGHVDGRIFNRGRHAAG